MAQRRERCLFHWKIFQQMIRGVVKKRTFYGQADCKGPLMVSFSSFVVLLWCKNTVFSKFSHLLTVRAKGADPPSPPPHGHPDCKISVFYTAPLMSVRAEIIYQNGWPHGCWGRQTLLVKKSGRNHRGTTFEGGLCVVAAADQNF